MTQSSKQSGKSAAKASSWLRPDLFIQHPDASVEDILAELPDPERPATPRRYHHLINLFRPLDHDRVLELTAQSMLVARDQARCAVEFINIQDENEADATPDGFKRGPVLTRSTLTEYPGVSKRQLPFLFDILEAGAKDVPDEDYIVYTNADICLKPSFYNFVDGMVDRGFDAMIINRRDLPEHLMQPQYDGLIETVDGVVHGGFDCFIFRKSLLETFERNNVSLGVVFLGWALMFNMFAKANRCALFTNTRITYHFGDDERPVTLENSEMRLRNTMEHQSLVARLIQDPDVEKMLRAYCAYVDQINLPRQKVPVETRVVLHEPQNRDAYARGSGTDLKPDPRAVTAIAKRDRQRLFVHIGKPKTGTTSLQRILEANRTHLAARGLLIPDFFKMPSREEDGFAELLETLKAYEAMHFMAPFAFSCLPVAARRHGVTDEDALTRFLQAHLDDLRADPRKDILISHESLAGPKLQFGNLQALLEGFDVTIIMSVRRFDEWSESRYRQDLRGAPRAHWDPNTSPFVKNLTSWSPVTVLPGFTAALPDADILLQDYATEYASGALVERFLRMLGQTDLGGIDFDLAHEGADASQSNASLSARSDLFLKMLHQFGATEGLTQRVHYHLRAHQDAPILSDPKPTSLVPAARHVGAHGLYNKHVALLRALYKFPGDVAQPKDPRQTLMRLPQELTRQIADLLRPSLPPEDAEEIDRVLALAHRPKARARRGALRAKSRPEMIVLAGQAETNIPALQFSALSQRKAVRQSSGIVFADLGHKGHMPHRSFFEACMSAEAAPAMGRKLDRLGQSLGDRGALFLADYRLMFPEVNFAHMAQMTAGFDLSIVALIRRFDDWLEDRWLEMLKSPADLPADIEDSFVITDMDKFIGLEALRRMQQAMPEAKITALNFDALLSRGLSKAFFKGLGVDVPQDASHADVLTRPSVLAGMIEQAARRAGAPAEVLQTLRAACGGESKRLNTLQNKLEIASRKPLSLLPDHVREAALAAFQTAVPDFETEFGFERQSDLAPSAKVDLSRPEHADLQRVFNVIAHRLDEAALGFFDAQLGLKSHGPVRLASAKMRKPSDVQTERKVVAFSLFGDDPSYFKGAHDNALACQEIYPEWECRIYVSPTAMQNARALLEGTSVRLIEMPQATPYDGLAWRFLAAADPDVDVMISRDLDTTLSARDRTAVDDWLASDKAFHVIRDHPSHTAPMLAGLWGARWNILANLEEARRAFAAMQGTDYRTWDQDFLGHCVYLVARESLHVHSEFVIFDGEDPQVIPQARDGNAYLGLPAEEGERRAQRLAAFERKRHVGRMTRVFSTWEARNLFQARE